MIWFVVRFYVIFCLNKSLCNSGYAVKGKVGGGGGGARERQQGRDNRVSSKLSLDHYKHTVHAYTFPI